MRISIITIFPELFETPLRTSLVGKAIANGHVAVDVVDLRRWGKGTHRAVDDAPFGGGAGMVMMVEPIDRALESIGPSHSVLLAAAGRRLDQKTIDRWAQLEHLAIVCGRYEGVDERVAEHLVDEEVSVGDFVMLGGEVGALAIVDAVVRLHPGVVGNPESLDHESFRHDELEEPQYTRPANYRGWEVPDVLLSGDHASIEAWRSDQRRRRTAERRPDLAKPSEAG